MKTAEVAIQIGIDEIPLPSTYGAAELKYHIRQNTYRGGIAALILLLFLLLINIIMVTAERSATDLKVAPITKTSLDELPPQHDAGNELPPPPEIVINTGPAARAGNPIPVPDAMIAPDIQDFATIDVAARASAEGGSGEDMGGYAGNINWDNVGTDVKTMIDREPDPDEFIPVEKEPAFDMARLQRSVEYPDMARRAGIEGTVVVRALVDKSGKVVRAQIDLSDNRALDQSALKAVLNYGHATPAIMNGQPTTCWVSIPIVFKLK